MLNNSDWKRNGDLKSNVRFSWIGEVNNVAIKRYSRLSKEPGQEGEVERESYYLEIQDSYGFSCSFFKHDLSQESAYSHAAKIPYGVTLLGEGEIKIRRGKTFFNLTKLTYPDESPVFAWRLTQDKEE